MPVWQKIEVPVTVDIKVPEWKVSLTFDYTRVNTQRVQTILKRWEGNKEVLQNKAWFSVL